MLKDSNPGRDLLHAVIGINLIEDLSDEKEDKEGLPIPEIDRIAGNAELIKKYNRTVSLLSAYGLTDKEHLEFPIYGFCKGRFIPPRLLDNTEDLEDLLYDAEVIGIKGRVSNILIEDPFAKNRRDYSFIIRDFYLSVFNFRMGFSHLLNKWINKADRYKGYKIGLELIQERVFKYYLVIVLERVDQLLAEIINHHIKTVSDIVNDRNLDPRTDFQHIKAVIDIL